MPARDAEAFIGQAIASVLGQTEVEFELIVVDDGSTDDSFKFLRRLREVHVVRSKGIGVAKARNFGASHANGDVIVFCDAHMKLPPRWHRALIEPLESREVGAAAPGIYSVTEPTRRGFGLYLAGPELRARWKPRPRNWPRRRERDPVRRISSDSRALRSRCWTNDS